MSFYCGVILNAIKKRREIVIIHCKNLNHYDMKIMSHTYFMDNRSHCVSINFITNKPQSDPFGCTGTLSGYEILKLKKSQSR